MALDTETAVRRGATHSRSGLPVIDCDVHNVTTALDPEVAQYLSHRWRTYLETIGLRNHGPGGTAPHVRASGCRIDSRPPDGRMPGSSPELARVQLLDAYGISAGILNNYGLAFATGGPPPQLSIELARAYNEWTRDYWFPADPRWYGSIVVPVEQPQAAAAEIARCHDEDSRFVQAWMGSHTEHPMGNTKYWEMYEALVAHDLPIAVHPSFSRSYHGTGSGYYSYYFEQHTGFLGAVYTLVASMIFEGVFERFPNLKVVLVELGWSWAAPFSWRLDATWRVLRGEVSHLQRKPSDYLRDHFWFTTQPIEEPPHPRWFGDLLTQFERCGMGNRLMFSSDYPHWDFDSPDEALPVTLPREAKRRILAGNASALYGIPLDL